MTIYINDQTELIYSNNVEITGDLEFILTSQYGKVPETYPAVLISQNARYTELSVDFGVDFQDQHKNGVYYYTIASGSNIFEEGLAKIICEPGGSINTLEYNSGVVTENRESAVYYRPQY